jgi:hypothetical protein
MAEKTGLEVCKLLSSSSSSSSSSFVVDTLSVTVPFIALRWRPGSRFTLSSEPRQLGGGTPSSRPARDLGSAAEGVVGLAESDRGIRRDAPPKLPLVSTLNSFSSSLASVRRTLRGRGVSSRGGRGVSTPVRLVVHVRRQSVWRLGAIRDPRDRPGGDRHRGEATSAIATRKASPATALGTSVRGLVNANLPSVEPEQPGQCPDGVVSGRRWGRLTRRCSWPRWPSAHRPHWCIARSRSPYSGPCRGP